MVFEALRTVPSVDRVVCWHPEGISRRRDGIDASLGEGRVAPLWCSAGRFVEWIPSDIVVVDQGVDAVPVVDKVRHPSLSPPPHTPTPATTSSLR